MHAGNLRFVDTDQGFGLYRQQRHVKVFGVFDAENHGEDAAMRSIESLAASGEGRRQCWTLFSSW
jgi:hypothetical protein